ncbi:CMRF35-like molecule 6 [Eretmochelys imbricata]
MGIRTMRIFSVLLWILFPGCWAVTGPGAVRGPPGGSVAVRCRYRGGFEDDPKFWCREGERWRCSNGLFILETSGSEAEVRRGRVSIRDSHTELAFTVTVENLTRADAGTYQCGVERFGLGPRATVELTVSPAVPYAIQTEMTPQGTKQPDVSSPTKAESSFSPTAHTTPTRFQPIIICFLLLVLLKGLLLLCIVCVLIWMSVRYRRSPREMVPDRQAHELPLC